MCEMTVFRHWETRYRTVIPTGRETNKVILGLLLAFCLDAVSELWFGEGETQEHSGLLDLKRQRSGFTDYFLGLQNHYGW